MVVYRSDRDLPDLDLVPADRERLAGAARVDTGLFVNLAHLRAAGGIVSTAPRSSGCWTCSDASRTVERAGWHRGRSPSWYWPPSSSPPSSHLSPSREAAAQVRRKPSQPARRSSVTLVKIA